MVVGDSDPKTGSEIFNVSGPRARNGAVTSCTGHSTISFVHLRGAPGFCRPLWASCDLWNNSGAQFLGH